MARSTWRAGKKGSSAIGLKNSNSVLVSMDATQAGNYAHADPDTDADAQADPKLISCPFSIAARL